MNDEEKCSVNGCGLERYRPESNDVQKTYAENDKCVLHCDKSARMQQNISTTMEIDFKRELENYINKQVKLTTQPSKSVCFKEINFPVNYDKYGITTYEYLSLLKHFKKIQFIDCHFYHESNGHFNLANNIAVLFDCCVFHGKTWYLKDYKPFSTIDNDYNHLQHIYHHCEFKGKVSSQSKILNYSQFFSCEFKSSLTLEGCTVKKPLFIYKDSHHDQQKNGLNLGGIYLSDCSFEERFEMNDYVVASDIEIENCIFHKKFNFKNNTINNTTVVNDCNFLNIADFYSTEFKQLARIEKCNFEKIAVFEHCKFDDNSSTTEFRHVTFKEQTQFRDAQFKCGLDIATANFYGDTNFLNVAIKGLGAKRETFRLIKHNFDRAGNILEANNYFVKEMQAYQKELLSKPKYDCLASNYFKDNTNKILNMINWFIFTCFLFGYLLSHNTIDSSNILAIILTCLPIPIIALLLVYLAVTYPTKNFSKILIFTLNKWISNFGQSYLRPVVILLLSMLSLYLITKTAHNLNFLMSIGWFECSVKHINGIFTNVPILSHVLGAKSGDNLTFIRLVFYIWYSVLIWQIIVAVKRHVRR